MVASQIIDYISSLRLSGGDHDGKLFEVLGWEKRFIRGAFRQPGDAALTVGRGCGKTGLVAGLATAVVDPSGPLHRRRREVVCVASSFDQSRVIFEDVLAFLGDKYDLGDRAVWRRQDSANRAVLEYRASGCKIKCVGSDPAKMHGSRANIVLADEPSQWDHAKSERMLSAIRTGLGKSPNSRLVALGTRPSDESHWFSRMLNSASCYSQVHAARPDDPPFWLRSIRRANPSHDHLPSLAARIQAEIVDARIDPDALASFKALRLNMGMADHDRSTLIDSAAWSRAEALEGRRSGPYCLGVDLGQNAAMSAAAAYWQGGDLEAVAVFPFLPDLRERGLADGVGSTYVRMAERGELLQAGRRVSDIPALLAEALSRWGRPAAVVCDRWREAELRQCLEAVRFPKCPVIVRGQGFKDGGQDVRDFRKALLGGLVRPSESLLLRSALAEARVVGDPSGNWKLAKSTQGQRKAKARDDAAAASILAVSAGYRQWHLRDTEPQRARYRSAVVG